jgi:hypothetical protein
MSEQPAVILGQVDPLTLQRIQMRKKEEKLVLQEFGTMQNFYKFLRAKKLSREQWLRESLMSYAVEDAFDYLMRKLLPRGKLRMRRA